MEQAYASSRIASGTIQQILHWPGSFETFRKVPTCLLYDEHGQVLAWGLEAKNASPMLGTVRCEWYVSVPFFFWPAVTCRDVLLPLVSIRFKLFLEPRALRDETTIDPRLPQLPASSPPRRAVTYAVSHSSYLFLPFLTAGQNGYEFDRRLPDMSVGVRERRNHPRDRSGRRSK